MKRIVKTVLLAACCSFLIGCSTGSILRTIGKVSPSASYQKTTDIAYGTEPRQKMDLYVPEKKSTASKTVVFVYGGAWRTGNKNEYEFVAETIASMGHTVLVPDYRLFPAHKYPDFITDVADAIAYCEQSVPTCRPDVEPLVIMGHSAGAHSAALIATDPQVLRDAGTDLSIAGLIGLSGPYDLPLDDPEVIPVFSQRKSAESVNPVALANEDSPPALLLHGSSDERVKTFHSERLAAALVDANVPVSQEMVKGGHARLLLGMSGLLGFLSVSNERVEQFLGNPDLTTGAQ